VLFRQFVDEGLGCASYLVGDEHVGVAVVVDPAYAIEPYLEEAARHGVRIERVLETHTHADHVSGHGRLALEHEAAVAVHPAAEPEFPFEPLDDGAEIEVGEVSLHVLHTPGHRPEHCAFAVADRSRSAEPWLVLTGDSLLVGDAARPDLAVAAEDGARGLFHSLRRLTELGDGVELYPGHVAGSLCGAGMSSKGSSTIGFERRFNPVFGVADEDAFVQATAAATQPRPPNMTRIVELNRGQFVAAPAELWPLERWDGATVIDVRPAATFAAGHVHGAFNVPVAGSSFATRAAFLLEPGERIALHGSSQDEVEQAARGLRSVGFLELEGYLVDPPTPDCLDPVAIEELERLLAEDAVELLDVREADERDAGYIGGSRHVPYRLVRVHGEELADGRPVVTICETGSRAAIAASVLAAAGVDARPVISGGFREWRARGNQLVEFRRCGA
jgi:glyoxylase-like metal-dependent hydrolase (beta-lactamase superfamily II)/rhodanese-related sulfurtransferase